MDLNLARTLTTFFANQATRYPYFIGKAHIEHHNNEGTRFQAVTTTPAQTAAVLNMFTSGGLFTPGTVGFCQSLRLSFDMVRRVESAEQDRTMRGINMTFRPGSPTGLIWHHAVGGQFHGPGIDKVADTLDAAGRDWGKVSFVPCVQNRQLRIVN